MITEIDVDERENVKIEAEILKPTGKIKYLRSANICYEVIPCFLPFIFDFIELFDDDDDISGKKFYEKPETYKKGAMLEKAKNFKHVQSLNPTVHLEKLPLCKIPTKKKKGS